MKHFNSILFHKSKNMPTSSISIYEGKVKSFRPSLRKTRDKRPLGRVPNWNWCYRHITNMIKHCWSRPWPHGHRQHTGKVKSSRLILQPTRDKRPLARNPDRSWCHRHTSVKLSWLQPKDLWTERQHTRMLPLTSMEPWAATKNALQ